MGARDAHKQADEYWLNRREAEQAEEFCGYLKERE